MSYENAIEAIKKEVEMKLRELEGLYIAANQLCKLDNMPPLYVVGEHNKETPQNRNLKGDEYYGKPLATVITEVLQKRKDSAMGPATLEEVISRMKDGGYVFDAKDPLLAVSISMGKNRKFTKLPNEKWGLTEWYPNVREKKVATDVIIGPEVEQPQQEAETPVIVKTVEQPKRRGRPPKQLVQTEIKKEEPKE